jgi:hypothetical protein
MNLPGILPPMTGCGDDDDEIRVPTPEVER